MISKPTGLFPDETSISLGNIIEDDNPNIFTTVGATGTKDYISEDGSIKSHSGSNNSDYTSVTDYIAVEPNATYIVSGINFSAYCYNAWYDEDKQLIETFSRHYVYSYKAPSNAKYLRITYYNTGNINSFYYEIGKFKLRKASYSSNALKFSCQMLSGNSVETFKDSNNIERAYAMLVLWHKNTYYNFFFGSENNGGYAPIIHQYESYIKVDLTIDNVLEGTIYGYCYSKNGGGGITYQGSVDLYSILRTGRTYSWKLRFYEKNSLNEGNYTPSVKVAYGTISNCDWVYSDRNASPPSTTGVRFDIFPHQNIYDKVVERVVGSNDSNNSLEIPTSLASYPYISDTVCGVMKNYDSNIHYWISDGEYILPITKYRFYKYSYDKNDDAMGNDAGSNISKCFDSYGNPLSGYAILKENVEFNNEKVFYDNNTLNTTKRDSFKGEAYSILTNYIDSDWAYFTLYNEPTITLRDGNGNEITGTETININYSSIDLSITYEQNQGVAVNYFSYKIYYYDDSTDEYVLDYASQNLYNQSLNISYDRLFNNRLYKIVISIVDTNSTVFEKEAYFKTVFPNSAVNLYAKAQYYRPHNSVIVDWSNINSINPTEKINVDACSYYIVTDDDYGYILSQQSNESDSKHSLYIPYGSSITYTTNDFGDELDFEDVNIHLEFHGTNLTCKGDKILTYRGKDGFYAAVSYLNGKVYVVTSNYSCSFSLYASYDISDLENALSLETETIPATTPYIWDDDLVWNDSYFWHEYDNIETNIDLTITTESASLVLKTSETTLEATPEYLLIDDVSMTPHLTLYGDLIYDNIEIYKRQSEQTVLLCDFNKHMNGASFGIDLTNLIGFRIYKTFGNSDKLYEIGYTTATDSRVLEDFVVGDNCLYTYYIFAIIIDDNENSIISTPIITNSIILDEGIDKVFGLKEIDDGIYEVASDEVWRIQYNLSDDGYTLNTDKTFYDTFNKFNQEIVGNRKYITKSISGLIGYLDCSAEKEYIDTYDMLTSWNDFSSSPSFKCLIDVRGLVLPGNFEANPAVEYMNVSGSPATAKFNWRQKADLDTIKIYGTLLPLNPLNGTYLQSSEGYYLSSSDPHILYTSE